ncbi:MAG: hypothetical protein AAFO28_08435 [Pseudomonadota bacterium]
MRSSLAFVILVLSAAGAACSPSNSSTTLTMYLAKTEPTACKEERSEPDDPVDIGGQMFRHYPESGLVCVSDKNSQLIGAYRPESNQTATHRWIMQGGTTFMGTKHTFEPVPRDSES